MLNTRTYRNFFIEVKSEEIEMTCHNKAQAETLKENILEVVKDLENFIENSID